MLTPDEVAQLQRHVGWERMVSDGLDPGRAANLAATLNHQTVPTSGDALPPCWHWLYFNEPVKTEDLGADGHPLKGDHLPKLPFSRRMWASGRLELVRPLTLGQRATRSSRLAELEYKVGRSGELLFLTFHHEIEQGGIPVLREQQQLVYRPAHRSTAASRTPAASVNRSPEDRPPDAGKPQPAWSESVIPDPVLLFRYSACTGNSHRIHYDRSYAINEEGFSGLVVHGPLQATLLATLLAKHMPHWPMAGFEFRAIRPLIEGEPFKLCGAREKERVQLWTELVEGQVAMTASATVWSP